MCVCLSLTDAGWWQHSLVLWESWLGEGCTCFVSNHPAGLDTQRLGAIDIGMGCSIQKPHVCGIGCTGLYEVRMMKSAPAATCAAVVATSSRKKTTLFINIEFAVQFPALRLCVRASFIAHLRTFSAELGTAYI